MTRAWPSREEWAAAAERSVRTACLPLQRVPEGAEHYLRPEEAAEMNRLNVLLAAAARPILTAEIRRLAEQLPQPVPTARTRQADRAAWHLSLTVDQMRVADRMQTLRRARTSIGRQAKAEADLATLTTRHRSPLTYMLRDLVAHLDGWTVLRDLHARYDLARRKAAQEAEDAAVAKAIAVRNSDEGWAAELERRRRIEGGSGVHVHRVPDPSAPVAPSARPASPETGSDSSRAHDRGHPGRRTRIRLDRFRPTSTGYRLVTDAPAEPARADELLKLWQAGRRMGEDRG